MGPPPAVPDLRDWLDHGQLLDAFTDAVVAADERGVIVYANEAAYDLLAWDAGALVGRALSELVPPRLRDMHQQGFARYLETREPQLIGRPVRVPALRADGDEVQVELTLSAVPTTGNGEVFVGALRDLRQRVELERESEVTRRLLEVLAASSPLETRLPRVLEALGQGLGWDFAAFWSPDDEGELLCCRAHWHDPERALEAFVAATREGAFPPNEGLPGRVWASGEPAWLPELAADDNFPRADAARAGQLAGGFAFPVAAAGKVIGVVELFRREETKEDPLLLRTMVAIGDQLGQFIQHRLTYEQLVASRARLDLALDAAGMGIWEWDAATERFQWSRQAEVIHGLGPGELPETYGAWSELVHPEDLERVADAVRAAWRAGGEFAIEYRLVQPDGSVRWVEGKGRVLRDGADRKVGLTGVLMDVTPRKEAEQERERLAGDRIRVAETLQRSLLPPGLPSIPGADLASRYRATVRGQIGGDFFDLFPLRGQTWGVAIGDVRGKGPGAAAVIAKIRYTLRAAAIRTRAPGRALEQLNEAMLFDVDAEEDPRFCTIAFARLQPTSEGLEFVIASGGHPSPLVVRRDGGVETVDVGGMLVGALPEVSFGRAKVRLAPGDALVLYTDGVTEARIGKAMFGEGRLATELASVAGQRADAIAGHIHDTVLAAQPQPRDDIAMLVIRAVDVR